MGKWTVALMLVASLGCGRVAATMDAGGAATSASAVTTTTSATAAPSVATTASASATATASAAPDVTCARPSFKLARAGKPTNCIKPCSADSDCARGEKCHELGATIDPKGLEQAEFCFPPEHVAPVAAQSKCAAGEVLIQARYEPLCSKKCRTNEDCGSHGPCVDTPAASGDTVKVCEATGDPPK
jgi:hypothetical protein